MSEPLAQLYNRTAREQKASSIREICKLSTRPEIKSLAGGWPGADTFPVERIAEIAADLLAERGPEVLQYGTTEGLPALRESLAVWARDREGMRGVTADHLMLLHGAQQGVDLCIRVLIEPGDLVLVGLPTYFGGSGAFAAARARLVGIPVDADGLNVDLIARRLDALRGAPGRVKALYVVPNFQNPTGVCLSRDRRLRLLELAVEHDFVIVEDDPYGELRFEGESIPSLKALEPEVPDAAGRVVHIHSVSKTFAPGLRLAWLAADPGLVRKLVVAKQYVDCCTNTFGQALLQVFVQKGLLAQQIETNRAHYRIQRDVMLEALDAHMPEAVSWNRPAGGLFVFITLPKQLDADALMVEALAEKVAFISGSQFFCDGSGKNTLRLSYAQAGAPTIRQAVATLGALLHRKLSS